MRRYTLTLLAASLAAAATAAHLPPAEADVAACDTAASPLTLLLRRAEAGDPKALYDLAYLHDTGLAGVSVDTAASTALYRRSAEAGYAPAQNYLGYRLMRGEGVERDPGQALMWIEKAAAQGDAKAANNLGSLLMSGEAVQPDYAKAAYWLRRASDAGLPAGMAQLADMHRLGLGMQPDTLLATELYTRAAAGGLADAQLKLLSMNARAYAAMPPDEAIKLADNMMRGGAPAVGCHLYSLVAFPAADSISRQPGQRHHEVPDSLRAHALAALAGATALGKGVAYDYDRSLDLYLEAAELGDSQAAGVLREQLDIFPDLLDSRLEALPPCRSRRLRTILGL